MTETVVVESPSPETVIIQAPDSPPDVVEVGPRFSGSGKTTLQISNSPALPAINTDVHDVVNITNQAVDIQSFSTNLTGSPQEGDTLRISVTGVSVVAITWGSSFESSQVILPAVAQAGIRMDIGMFYNSNTSKWRCVGIS